MAVLDLSFAEMAEVLKPLYAAAALLGIHITRPFHHLLIDVDTNYNTLLSTFPKLYDELTGTDPELMITSEQVFRFVEPSMYKFSLPVDHLLNLVGYMS